MVVDELARTLQSHETGDVPGTPERNAVIGEGEHVCPECLEQGIERRHLTSQALGVHRARSHGVKGQAKRSRSRHRKAAESPRQVAERTRKEQGPAPEFDREKALRMVYPDGVVPVSEFSRTATWLDLGEAMFAAAQRRVS